MLNTAVDLSNSLEALLDHLMELFPDDNDARGKYFEKIVKWFLENDPQYSSLFETVWLWDEWPNNWGIDKGIDLIAKQSTTGQIWAIQVKCYQTSSTVSSDDINSFIAEATRPEIDHLFLISTGDITKNSRNKLVNLDKPVTIQLYPQLSERLINWLSFFDQNLPIVPEPQTPRPHQQEAIGNVLQGFVENDRGQLIMACGTGKTLVSIQVDEEMKNSATLVLVPSLALISQVSREWHANSPESFQSLFVCSDKTLGSKKDPYITDPIDLGCEVTTSPDKISEFLARPGKKVVFCTYHSSPQLSIAQQNLHSGFDLAIFDEAHHCTGRLESAFAVALDSDGLQVKKRLFMTATPRITPRSIKESAAQSGMNTSSMDDVSQFGTEFHSLSFGEAIQKQLLSDYQVVVIGISDSEIEDMYNRRRFVELEGSELRTDAEALAHLVGLHKAINKYDLHYILTFHGTIRKSQAFSDALSVLNANLDDESFLSDMETNCVSGDMNSRKRDMILKRFRNGSSDVNVISNCRCLGEGIDVRALDGIGFIDPKESTIDIIQAVGRVIRKADDEKIGTVVLPILIKDQIVETIDEQLTSSRFKAIWNVLKALKDHDNVLSEELDSIRYELGRRRILSRKRPDKVQLILPATVEQEFIDAIELQLVANTTDSWEFWLGILAEYEQEHGDVVVPAEYVTDNEDALGMWVSNQRALYNRGKLDKRRIAKLEEFSSWLWDATPKFRRFKDARSFVRKLAIPSENPDWRNYCKSEDKPDDIPLHPDRTYKEEGWISWGDWLGTDRIADQKKTFLNYEDCKEAVKNLGITSGTHWREYWKSHHKPVDIPYKPDRTYSGKGWRDDGYGWGDFLGTGRIADQKKTFLNYEDAKTFVRQLALTSETQWKQWFSENKPKNLPQDPRTHYRNKGWMGFPDFLGYDPKRP